jgi:hypothetical protein
MPFPKLTSLVAIAAPPPDHPLTALADYLGIAPIWIVGVLAVASVAQMVWFIIDGRPG